MSSFLEKVITVILIFVLLVLAPLLNSYKHTEGVTQRLVLNEVTQFIDRVTDKAQVTQLDIDDLYLGVNSHGGIFDVKVERYIRIASDDGGTVRTLYYTHDDLSTLNVGDVVKVTVEEVGMSSGRRLEWLLLKIDSGNFKFSLAGTVR